MAARGGGLLATYLASGGLRVLVRLPVLDCTTNTTRAWRSAHPPPSKVVYLVLLGVFLMRSLSSSSRRVAHVAHVEQPPPGVVCKRVAFVRHAEGLHNRDARLFEDFYQGRHTSPLYHDAPLTTEGKGQAEVLAGLVKLRRAPELVVSSTLTRALETARIAFPGERILATERCRERIAEYASDRRSPLSQLKVRFPNVDFSEVAHEHDHDFDSNKEVHPHPYNSEACVQRARRFVDWLLLERTETDIVVFTHWVFLSHLLRGEEIPKGTDFANAELRELELCRRHRPNASS